MAITISITLLLLLILKRTKLSYNAAAVFVTFFWVWFFLYASVRNFIIENNIFSFVGLAIDRHRYFMPIWVMVLVLFSIIIIRRKSSYENAKNYFNVTGIVLLLLQIGIGMINYASYNLNITGSKPSLETIVPNKMMSPKESLPPVYYIVLDAYGGAPALNEIMDFDNHDFINYLEERGFYVAKNSHSNYSDTAYCMSSTLNMQYLPMVDPPKSDSGTITLISGIPYLEMMNSNQVVKFLESIGYTYVNLSVFENRSFYFKNASFNSFNLELLKYSILGKIVIEDFVEGTLKREEILRQFKELENVPNLPGPTFVYAHILIPHEPYVFDRDGNEPSFVSRALLVAYKEKLYLDQLIFANKMTQKIIDKILAQSKKEPIIIVQGDHGPPAMGRNEEESRRLRMSILNAYYFPGGGSRRLYDSITPVNSFRIMLNYYFGQNLPLLVDESFFSKTKNLPLLVDESFFSKTIQTLIRMTPQLKEKNSEPKSK
jgi:predicted RNA binding protein YcfA (HicA-like mRNA interferase family)